MYNLCCYPVFTKLSLLVWVNPHCIDNHVTCLPWELYTCFLSGIILLLWATCIHLKLIWQYGFHSMLVVHLMMYYCSIRNCWLAVLQVCSTHTCQIPLSPSTGCYWSKPVRVSQEIPIEGPTVHMCLCPRYHGNHYLYQLTTSHLLNYDISSVVARCTVALVATSQKCG